MLPNFEILQCFFKTLAWTMDLVFVAMCPFGENWMPGRGGTMCPTQIHKFTQVHRTRPLG